MSSLGIFPIMTPGVTLRSMKYDSFFCNCSCASNKVKNDQFTTEVRAFTFFNRGPYVVNQLVGGG